MSSRRPYRSIFFLGPVVALALVTTSVLAQNDRPSRPAAIRGAELSAPVTPFVFGGEQAVDGVDRHHFMARFAQRIGDLNPGSHRHVSFVGRASQEDRDLHPVSACTTS